MREGEEEAGTVVGVLLVGIGVGGGGGRKGGGGAVGLQDGEDFELGEVEAEGFHGDFEFVVVDFVVFVQVEEVELFVSPRHVSLAFLISGHEICSLPVFSSFNWRYVLELRTLGRRDSQLL